ncbi:MAG: YcaO-like family protein [bacterium]
MKTNQKLIWGMSAKKWKLRPTPKYDTFGVSRTIPPEDTIERAIPLMKTLNVKNMEDIRRVDTDDIPVFVIKRKCDGSRDLYYKGKGYTENDSLASALMESVERYSSERFDGRVIYCGYKEIVQKGPAVNPDDLYARVTPSYRKELNVDWVQGFDLIRQCPTFAPLNLVMWPYVARPEHFSVGSVGLASGNTMEEAISHALCEVIEHDANVISGLFNPWNLSLSVGHEDSSDMTEDSLAERVKEDRTPHLLFPLIDIKTFPERAADVAGKLLDAGLLVFARNTTTDIGVPSVYCAVVKQCPDGTNLLYDGMGTHPDAEIALLRALCEAAQSHSAIIWLQERNLWESYYSSSIAPCERYGYGSTCRFSDIATYKHDTVDADIRFILRRLKAAGLNQVVAFDLTRTEIGLPVVRVIIPKTEYQHTEPGEPVLGPRAKKALDFRVQQFIANL